MKKCVLLAAALLSVLGLSAATTEEMIQTIADAGNARAEIKAAFTEIRSRPRKESVTLKGELVFRKEGYLHMMYENPEKENFLIDGDRMVNRRGGLEIKSDLSRNVLMRSLAQTLICAFSGQLETLSTGQKTSLEVRDDGDAWLAVLDAVKKLPRGYSHIEIRYRKSDAQIVSMKMDEFTGMSTLYQLAE